MSLRSVGPNHCALLLPDLPTPSGGASSLTFSFPHQPFCDGSHFFQRTGLSPLKFKAQETRTVALCTCKATQKAPYCDGTHRSERVQKAEVGSPL